MFKKTALFTKWHGKDLLVSQSTNAETDEQTTILVP